MSDNISYVFDWRRNISFVWTSTLIHPLHTEKKIHYYKSYMIDFSYTLYIMKNTYDFILSIYFLLTSSGTTEFMYLKRFIMSFVITIIYTNLRGLSTTIVP